MSRPLRRITLGALFALAIMPAAASAAFTPAISQSSVTAGCAPKGGLALPVGTTAPAGQTQYKITAVTAAGESAPCAALPSVTYGGGNQATFLQWAASPGATSYRVYRGDALLTTVPANATSCPTANAAARCQFVDAGPTTVGADTPPALPLALTAGGSHPDLNIAQTFDYGGAATNSSTDDPAPDGTANSASLKENILHFPAGLLASAVAADTTCSIDQLIGAPSTGTGGFGSLDAAEDTCPRASQVGQVVASIQSPPLTNPATPTVGDIYLGEKLDANDDVTARLFVALRPPCSAGYPAPLNPGGAACTARLGSATREVEKSFLSAKATIRQDGTFGIDNETTSVATGVDEDLAAVSNIRSSTTGAVLQPLPIQVRSLTQTLFGFADQGTEAGGDDKPFVTLPTNCAAKTLSADSASYLDPVLVSGSTGLQATNCEALDFSPAMAVRIDTGGQTAVSQNPSFTANIAQSSDEAATRTASVTLPEGLGTNLNALNNVCSVAQQNSAAGCPAASIVGSAEATTSVLPGTLSGPVYIAINDSPYNVSGLPKLIVSLDGAAEIEFDGTISFDQSGNRLVNSFVDLPEVTLSTFRLTINGGTGGLLQNTRNLCDQPLGNVDAAFLGYNGGTVTLTPAVVSDQAYYCIPDEGEPPVQKRKRPGLKVKLRPKNDKKSPFKYTAKGKVILPKGIGKNRGCRSGQVRLTLRRKGSGKPLSTTRKKIKKNCKFKVKTSFKAKRLKKSQRKKGKLKAIVRFQGNQVLKAKKVTKQASYGRKGKKKNKK